MSKKFFAKKFVAYSMAFAVAFASINVSPVFVKDAQAAAGKVTIVNPETVVIPDTTTVITNVADGMKWVDASSIVSTDTSVYPGDGEDDNTDIDDVELKDFVTDTELSGFGAGYLEKGNKITDGGAITNTYEYSLNNVDGVDSAVKANKTYLFDGVANKEQKLEANYIDFVTADSLATHKLADEEYVETAEGATHVFDEESGEYVLASTLATHKWDAESGDGGEYVETAEGATHVLDEESGEYVLVSTLATHKLADEEYVETTEGATHVFDEESGEYVLASSLATHKLEGEEYVETAEGATHVKNPDGVAWFKLNPVNGEFTKTTTGTNPKTATVSYTYYVAELITTIGSDDADKSFKLGMVSENAIYMAVESKASGLANVLAVYNVCEETDLQSVTTARKATTYSQVGKTAKMSVDVKTRRTNPNLTYKWTKSSKVLDCTEATLSLTDLKDSDFDYYQCEVSDGIATKKVEFTLKKLGAAQLEVASNNVKTLATDVNVLAGGKVASGVVNLTTSIPEGEFIYLWEMNGTKAILPETDVLAYDNTKRNVNIAVGTKKLTEDENGDPIIPTITCYAVAKKDYEDAVAENGSLFDEMEAIEDATTTVAKHTNIEKLRTEELSVLAGGAKYVETITLNESDATNTSNVFFKSEKKDVKFGDTVVLSAPSVKGYNTEYVWRDAAGNVRGNEDKLVIDTVDYQDLGMITLVVTSCGIDHTHKETGTGACELSTTPITTIVTFNMSYVSDLAATAKDVEAKANAKNVVLSVDATSSLDISYNWTLQKCTKSDNTVSWTTDNSGIISLTDAGTDKTDATLELETIGSCFYTGEVTGSYRFVCTVNDGMAEKEVIVKVKEISTFKVYLTDADKEADKEITNDDINDPYLVPAISGVEEAEVVLGPIVDVKEGIDVTYAWTCPQDPTFNSTDSKITVKYPKNSPVNYVLVIKEETKKVILQYTLNTIEKEDISITIVDEAADESDINTIVTADKEVVYTGTEINPVKSIVVDLDGSNYTLVEGTDYDVTLANAVNVGRGTYKITFKGVFEKTENGTANKTISGEFYINRAENEIEIAAVEGSLQPKTIKNPAKAALTYTYYTDEACTNAVEGVPTKAGDYYVVATSEATTNYNAGKSNVVKVTVAEEVKVGTVSNLRVTARSSYKITVAYNAADNADGYRVYYKNANTNGKYVRFAQGTKLGCTANTKVADLIAGATTKIAVKAYKMVDGKAVWADKYVEVTTKTAPGTTSKVAVTTTKNAAKIAWNKVSGANGYRVYVKTSAGWKKIAQGNNLSYTYKNLKGKTTYTFAVRAFNTVDGKSVLADKYVSKSAKTK